MQLLYDDIWKVLVSAGPSLQVIKDDLRVRELSLQGAMKETERVATVAVAASSNWELDVLKVQNAEMDFDVTRLHREIDDVKQLRVDVTRLGREVVEMTASSIDTANMREEALERAENLSAQLATGVCREDV